MTVKEIILIVLGAALANNYAIEKFLGTAPLLLSSREEQRPVVLGLAVTLVMLMTAAVAWPLSRIIPEAMQTLVFVAVILILVYVLQLIFRQRLGVCFALIALNSAVLGLAVNTAGAGSYPEALLTALGAGLGFLLGLLLLQGIESRIDEPYVPKAFRGLPVRVLALAILSMALAALNFK